MASIYERKDKKYYLRETVEGVVKLTYLGTRPPIAKSRGWKNLSPDIVTWLKMRAKQKTKSVSIEPTQKGKYRTIVIDPPWPMQRVEMIARTSEMPFDYPTMTISQIKNDRKLVPVRKLMNKTGCWVFLWTTQKFLPSAFDISRAWGLNYFFTMVWQKGRGRQLVGLPQYNCEFVLVGRKGKLDFIDTKAFATLFEGKAREHSQKPIEFYELLRRITSEPRLDMFNREHHPGFDGWGNEVGKLDEQSLLVTR